MGANRHPVRIPPAVVKNFLCLNLLIILTLAFTAFGLHYFLRPKAHPTLARTGGRNDRASHGVMVFWEIETERAKRILFEGMPILKRRYNP
ncbi:MAG TPA: hypothetical protein GXX33_02245 [Firmicutes bacterium]|uniref:Uncharacterized protein n=1 Tax=Capillibacterium thermochitinicola TaxID=2699427 RepID=A0A8J6LIW7_9FIRM|nr:hypothetical protein [Capillibacterium thermochitinicola]MBA2133126.1 hypothetical protein [Capillibacterium thermochitinicola]HHW11817.1 hypothetical protein [Bacillota bacterium]